MVVTPTDILLSIQVFLVMTKPDLTRLGCVVEAVNLNKENPCRLFSIHRKSSPTANLVHKTHSFSFVFLFINHAVNHLLKGLKTHSTL